MKKGANSLYLGPPPLPFGHPDCVGDGLQPEIQGIPGGAICTLFSDHARATTSRAFRPLNNTHRDGKYSCRHPGSVIVVDDFIKTYRHGKAHGKQIHLNLADGDDNSIDRIEYDLPKEFPTLSYTTWYSSGQKEACFKSNSLIGGDFICWYPNGQIRSKGIYGLRITLSRNEEINLSVVLYISDYFEETGTKLTLDEMLNLSLSDSRLYWPRDDAFDYVFAEPLARFAHRIRLSSYDFTVSNSVRLMNLRVWEVLHTAEEDKITLCNTRQFLQCESALGFELLISGLKTKLK